MKQPVSGIYDVSATRYNIAECAITYCFKYERAISGIENVSEKALSAYPNTSELKEATAGNPAIYRMDFKVGATSIRCSASKSDLPRSVSGHIVFCAL